MDRCCASTVLFHIKDFAVIKSHIKAIIVVGAAGWLLVLLRLRTNSLHAPTTLVRLRPTGDHYPLPLIGLVEPVSRKGTCAVRDHRTCVYRNGVAA